MRLSRCSGLVLPLLLAGACAPADPDKAGGETADPVDFGARGDCNPVDGGLCAYPFPSSFFLTEDPATPTGLRVDFGPTTMPVNRDGVPIDPSSWNRLDGFPILGRAMALLPGATTAGAATWDNPALSMQADSKTLIFDAETGELQPHYAELERFTDDTARRAMLLHPVRPLQYGRRYIVVMRGLVDASGAPVSAPDGFATLRDGAASEDVDLLRQRDHYEDVIFPAIEAQGVPRAELQLAWDFVTVSAERSLGPMLHMRDESIAALPASGPPFRVARVGEGECASEGDIGRLIRGEMTVPLYLTQWEAGNTSRLVWGADGLPEQNGTVDVPFTVQVPCALLRSPAPRPALQFGHGLFGDRSHAESGAVAELAYQSGQVVFAVDWTGMKDVDVNPVTLALATDSTLFGALTDRLHQGQLEALLAAELITTGLATDPNLIVDGVPLIDPSEVNFYGVSQGGILGGAQLALSPRVRRAIFSVPGSPFSMLLNRASPFQPFFVMLNAKYDDPADITVLIAMFQMLWDPGETAGWAPLMTEQAVEDLVPGAAPSVPDRQVLIQLAKGDRSVSTLGGHVFARSVGADLVAPGVREVYGLPLREPPFVGSAVQEFDFGWEEPAEDEQPNASEVGPHNMPFDSAEGIRQFAHFLRTGEVIAVCDGPCDPN